MTDKVNVVKKAYEVTQCFDCPNSRKDGHYCYCRERIEKGFVSMRDPIPPWCPLPDMPKKDDESTDKEIENKNEQENKREQP